MYKIIMTILGITAASLIYQTFLTDTPNYAHTAEMLYWVVFTTALFLANGVIPLKKVQG